MASCLGDGDLSTLPSRRLFVISRVTVKKEGLRWSLDLMPGMKKDGLSCWACASNRYEEFHAQHEKKKKKGQNVMPDM